MMEKCGCVVQNRDLTRSTYSRIGRSRERHLIHDERVRGSIESASSRQRQRQPSFQQADNLVYRAVHIVTQPLTKVLNHGIHHTGLEDTRPVEPSQHWDRHGHSRSGCQTSGCMAGPWEERHAGCRDHLEKVLWPC